MNHLFFRDQIRDNPEFLRELLVFNRTPEQLKVAGLDGALRDRILADRSLCEILRKHKLLVSTGETASPGYWSFTDECQRLALLAPDELRHTGLLLAATIFADDIASAVAKDDVLSLKSALGLPIYQWVLQRGRFEISDASRELFKRAFSSGGALSDRVLAAARMILETLRVSWPEPLQAKSARMFASLNLPALPAVPIQDKAFSRKLWFLVKKLVLRETDEQWTRYFK
jgi:hypothetical protein